MIRVSAFRSALSRRLGFPDSPDSLLCASIAFPLLFGVLIGSLLGLFSPAAAALAERFTLAADLPSGGVPLLLLKIAAPALLAGLCSTSLLGWLVLPLLALLLGGSVSCRVASLFGQMHGRGLLYAALSVAVPQLFGLPAFLLISCEGIRFSRRLLPSRSGAALSGTAALQHLLVAAVLLLAQCAYCRLIFPALAARLF